jgi:hypothetical protein
VQALADSDDDRRHEQRGGGDAGIDEPGADDDQRGDHKRDGAEGHGDGTPSAFGESRGRDLRQHDRDRVRQHHEPDQLCADADLVAGIDGDNPGEHTPAHGDDADVDDRQPHERPIAQDDPVAARQRLRPRAFAHADDKEQRVEHIGEGVDQEENDEAVQSVSRDDTAKDAAKPDAEVGGDARNGRGTMAQLTPDQGRDECRLARLQATVAQPSRGRGGKCLSRGVGEGEAGEAGAERQQ